MPFRVGRVAVPLLEQGERAKPTGDVSPLLLPPSSRYSEQSFSSWSREDLPHDGQRHRPRQLRLSQAHDAMGLHDADLNFISVILSTFNLHCRLLSWL